MASIVFWAMERFIALAIAAQFGMFDAEFGNSWIIHV
jgi:hypothetical protein